VSLAHGAIHWTVLIMLVVTGAQALEPKRVAESVRTMGLRYATVTGVCRDDLADEGAWLYAETIRKIRKLDPGIGVEMLAPDFSGNPDYLGQVFETEPEVFAQR
jgi:lipoyl synthase